MTDFIAALQYLKDNVTDSSARIVLPTEEGELSVYMVDNHLYSGQSEPYHPTDLEYNSSNWQLK